jgi:hypothetical protein
MVPRVINFDLVLARRHFYRSDLIGRREPMIVYTQESHHIDVAAHEVGAHHFPTANHGGLHAAA